MISERISDNMPPQIKILNMVIPILMNYQKDGEIVLVAPLRPTAARYIKPLASCIYSLVNQ